MNRLLITGGCGFIGVNLVASLLEAEWLRSIRVVDNLSVGTREELASVCCFTERQTGACEQIEGGLAQPKETGRSGFEDRADNRTRVELVIGDIRDLDLAKEACEGVDAVVHLAANTGVIPSIEEPMMDCMTNVLGTLNYLQGAREAGVARFILASSGAPLGQQTPPIHEELVPRPISPYGASKLAGEAYCSAYHGSFGLDTVVLRFGNVYGPRSNHKGSVVAKFIQHILADKDLTIYGDGRQTRDFIYVSDLVDAIVLAMRKSDVGGEVFQIATHREHTVGEVSTALNRLAEKYLGKTSRVVYEQERKGEVKRNYSDISKAKRLLGFTPRVDMEEGLARTFLWFLNNGTDGPR